MKNREPSRSESDPLPIEIPRCATTVAAGAMDLVSLSLSHGRSLRFGEAEGPEHPTKPMRQDAADAIRTWLSCPFCDQDFLAEFHARKQFRECVVSLPGADGLQMDPDNVGQVVQLLANT